ncbi:MAG: hypothetical protein JW924_12355 [Fusobacteriaceae bacterium]|nr:hypothetical protein [Fusobacteriaceae bacterium]
MFRKLMEFWIYVWFCLVPFIAIYNIFLSQRLIKKIKEYERKNEECEIEKNSIDIIKEIRRLINIYEESFTAALKKQDLE